MLKKNANRDLLSQDPEGCKEWDYEKNNKLGLFPNELGAQSNQKAWWICPKGHSYESRIQSHTIRRGCCPYCSNQKVLSGYNDLVTTDPEGVKEWDYEKNTIKPTEVFKSSEKMAWWICPKGHSYNMKIAYHSNNGSRCPYCADIKALKGYNDLQTIDPEGAKEWDYEKNELGPDEVLPNSRKKVWWKCPNGHSYDMSLGWHYKGQRCPYCSNRRILTGFNDLVSTDPQGIKEWDFKKNTIDPTTVAKFNSQKAWWICPKGHSYEMQIANHSSGNRCPYCSGKKVLEGFNDIFSIYPEFKDEWDYEKNNELGIYPEEISSGSHTLVWWKCPNGHKYESSPHIHSRGHKCPYCNSAKKVLIGFNDLLSQDPEGMKEWDYNKNTIKPDEVLSCSSSNAWWICPKGHSYEMPVGNHTNGQRCYFCSGVKVLSGFNDLITKDKEIGGEYGSIEWDYEKNKESPDSISAFTNRKVWWICPKGHSYSNAVCDHSNGYRCPYCSGRLPIKGETDLLSQDPEGMKEWDYSKNTIKPDEVTYKSNKKVWWICPKGHSYQAIVKSHSNKIGCRICDGKEILAGFNDLATKDPEGVKEWDYKKNTIDPTTVAKFNSQKAWWICPKGHSYEMLIINHSSGHRCPICNESAGEIRVQSYLQSHKINNKMQYKFDDCKYKRILPFDFAILDANDKPILIIEYDGEQHERPVNFGGISDKEAQEAFELTKIRDKIKTDYCKENKIPLLRITYKNFDKIENILDKELKKYNLI